MTRSKTNTLADKSSTAGGAKQRTQLKRGAAKHKPDQQGNPQQKLNPSPQNKRPRKAAEKKEQHETEVEAATTPTAKRAKLEDSGPAEQLKKSPNDINPKIHQLISTYGKLPLQNLGLSEPNSPTPENLLALIFYAMLTSARISHQLAYKSVKCLLDAGYQDIEVLHKSTWEERTKVLTEGGYTHYREKTATALGELADIVKTKYGEYLLF